MGIQDIADTATEIYGRLYRAQFEEKHRYHFVVIDIKDEKAYVHETPEGALQNARKAAPHGVFHLMRIGSPGAFTGGLWPRKEETASTLAV